jgi:hypothetical protein
MRIQHVAQAAKSWPDIAAEDYKTGTRLSDTVERIRWRLWHGQVGRGPELIGETIATLDAVAGAAPPAAAVALKVGRLLGELETYVCVATRNDERPDAQSRPIWPFRHMRAESAAKER